MLKAWTFAAMLLGVGLGLLAAVVLGALR